MAKQDGVVTLRGRFRAGTEVRLVKVAHEGVLRSEGGQVVESKQVDDDGAVSFTDGVEVGARYFIVGRIGGELVEVRVRGNVAGEDFDQLLQASVPAERQKLASGVWADEVRPPGAPRQADVDPGPEQSGLRDRSPVKRDGELDEDGAQAASEAASAQASAKTVRGSKRNPSDDNRVPAPRKARAPKTSTTQTTTAKPARGSARKEK